MRVSVLAQVRQHSAVPKRTRSIDWALVAGLAFFGALLLIAIYGPLVAPHDVYYSRALINGQAPPFPPSPEYALGSDSIGRDRLSWLLIGARGSVIIAVSAAALRMGIGATLGLMAGFRGGLLGAFLRRLALGMSSIPATVATLLGVIALGGSPEQFVLAFGLIGWAEPFHQARRYARSESARPFMESARSLGLSNRRLVFRHLLPNVAPQLLTTAAFQVSAVLLLMAELALLNIFVGGAIVVDYDSRGNAIVAPRIPNWASMLAATRPIVSLYGDLASILLPATALLSAVLATNLFGDALAARAQRLDVYRLFSRRQVFGLAVVALVVALSVAAWPSRLAAEIEYARGFDAATTRDLASELASIDDASARSTLLARHLDGEEVSGRETFFRATGTELSVSGTALPVDAYAIDDADASGPLVYLDTLSLFSGRTPDAINGAIVLTTQPISGLAFDRLAGAGARALVGVDIGQYFRRDHALYALPVVGTTRAALVRVLGRPLPDLRAGNLRYAVLADTAHVHVTVEQREQQFNDVVARAGSSAPDAPIVVVVAEYESSTETNWERATAAAMLAGVLDHVRCHPLALTVVALATSADDANFAGLRLGLAQLTAEEQRRVQALIFIGPQLSGSTVISTQAIPGVQSGVGRMSARVSDALGLQLAGQVSPDLVRAVGLLSFITPPVVIGAPGQDAPPQAVAYEHGGEAILVSLAYVPRHQLEMK